LDNRIWAVFLREWDQLRDQDLLLVAVPVNPIALATCKLAMPGILLPLWLLAA